MIGQIGEWVIKMDKYFLNHAALDELSRISNAVLTPDLNTCVLPLSSNHPTWATMFDHNQGDLSEADIKNRMIWCANQIEHLKTISSNAVLGA